MEDEIQSDVVSEINQISAEKHSWVVEIKDKFSKMESIPQKERSQKRENAICRLPATIRKNIDYYDYAPYKVSFGPYHHGNDSCKQTQQIKENVVLRSLKRFNKTIDDYIHCLNPYVQTLKDAYDELDPKWEQDDDAFLQLMIYDGCFLPEIFREVSTFYNANFRGDDYDWDSPIWCIDGISPRELMEKYRHDVLLLENQILLLVLENLFAVQMNTRVALLRGSLDEIILTLAFRKVTVRRGGLRVGVASYEHVLDMYRHNLLWGGEFRLISPLNLCSLEFCCGVFKLLIIYIFIYLPYIIIMGVLHKTSGLSFHTNFGTFVSFRKSGIHFNIPSATDLDKVGIGFTISDTDGLMWILFKGRNLTLPQISMDAAIKSVFLNVMALERLDVHAEKVVTSYIYFMSKLIQSADDVRILQSRGIIQSRLHGDEIADLFNSLTTEGIMPHPHTFFIPRHQHMADNLAKSFYKISNEWKRDLWQNYLRSPWAIVSLIAAFLLFALSAIQTIYTVLGYYHS